MLTTFLLASIIGQTSFNLVVPLQIAETQTINLGHISNLESARCRVASNLRSGDACVESEWGSGVIRITGGIDESIMMRVSTVSADGISFIPLLSNGTQSDMYLIQDGVLDVSIGGELTLLKSLALGQYKISYMVEVNYQ
ncbi:hypothetical protein FM037_15435 [Shewanella psychropiezotolerans]|uniref:DUF4402 domain-containing protein n=1 Tax=Shewanella psychropiezotolerans TaxID=2593655 RepID=A0ABX5X514_9GAMM|nr:MULTISPECIES: hypothetical protein [Shewanella]MPY24116.1 hypothetical protein [Shewanella sp. YLB-07]QDO84351.1 hypothetical protein FM037_15435 [Shewanella psychropiezotolerans]